MFSLEMSLYLGISYHLATIPSAPCKDFICPVAETQLFQAAHSLATSHGNNKDSSNSIR